MKITSGKHRKPGGEVAKETERIAVGQLRVEKEYVSICWEQRNMTFNTANFFSYNV